HLEDALRVADAHEGAGLPGRQDRRCPLPGLDHLGAVFSDGEPAERVAVEVELGDLLDRAAAQVWIRGALGDAEPELPGRARRVPLPAGPDGGAAHGVLEVPVR